MHPAAFSATQANRYRPFFMVMVSLFVLSTAIPKGTDVLFINGHHTRFLDWFFRMATNLGDGLIFVPVIIVLLFNCYRHAIICVILAVVHGLLVSGFKHSMFQSAVRPRKYLGDHLIHFVPGVDVHSIHSFPSGHTATAFCLALFLALLSTNRLHTFLLLGLAMVAGCSRIYLAQHFLIDVAAGAIIGSFTTFITWEVFRSVQTPQWMNGRMNQRECEERER